MHEVEGEVKADNEKPEMQFAERLAVDLSGHLREPVVKGTEKTEEDATDDYVVKMRNHEIRTPQLPVEGSRSLHYPRETSDQELEKKSDTEQHRSLELNLSAPHGC